jgi:hypothetical protein
MELPLAFAGFSTLLGAWIAIARRRPTARTLPDDAAGEPGFLRRLGDTA